jgi:hypothetical protein
VHTLGFRGSAVTSAMNPEIDEMHIRLFSDNELVELGGSVLVVSLVPQYSRQTSLNQLLSNIAIRQPIFEEHKSRPYLF